ncbi:MAG: TetR/AcrR family transcriptional regulator [Ancrocorticia sp.]
MSDQRVDQRVRLTRTLLNNALVKLIKDQHISKISVRALCDEAGVNRSTFYAHYSNPYDLLESIESEVLESLGSKLEQHDFDYDNPISTQALATILEYISQNADLFKALISKNSDHAFQKDVIQLAQVFSENMNHSVPPPKRADISKHSQSTERWDSSKNGYKAT